jgi:HAD superfamily hydrolase (TIGR01509 family)
VNGSIRTVFWDIGGVVLTKGWDLGQRARVLKRLGVNLQVYEELHDRANYSWERGLMTAEEFFLQTVFSPDPNLPLTFDMLWPQVCAESRVLYPECLDLLAELKQMGQYRVATLNNESRELNEYRLDAFKLRSLFDFFICSGYVHEMKPTPGIYNAAVDISGFAADTALFIDDKKENCAAAMEAGMNAIFFETPAKLCADLAGYGIKLQSL